METKVNEQGALSAQLENTFRELLQLLSSLNEEQLNQKPFEGSWTAAQVGDHLLKSYGVAETLVGQTCKTERPVDANIGTLNYIFLNFQTKLESPEFVIPSNEPINKQELIQQLKQKMADIIHTIRSADPTETCLDFEMPGIGFMTRWEWGHFVIYHTQRHIHQLKKIRQFVCR